jgi:hypothetical protein
MLRIAIQCVLVLAVASHVGAAKPEFSVNFACGWDGCYRPMEWTPVEVGISSNVTEPLGGSLVLAGPQDAQNNLNIVHPFVLTPNVALTVPLVTKLKFGLGTCTVTLRDERGRTCSEQAIDLWDPTARNRTLQVVRDADLLIGVVGQPLFNVLRLSQEAEAVPSRRGPPGKVYVAHKSYRSVPWDWTGFASLDLLILYNPDWAQFRPEQTQAIRAWVSNGGTLLLVLGSHPLPADSPLAQSIPFSLGEPRQTAVPESVLAQWELASGSAETVTAWPLSPKPNAFVCDRPESLGGLFGLGLAGFGRVAVLAFDPAQLGPGQAAHSAAFWTNRIGVSLADQPASDHAASGSGCRRTIRLGRNGSAQPGNTHDYVYESGMSQNWVNQILELQYDLRQMRPLSIWWVILILALMATLLGPVDYFVLKRLDRLPLTWLTSLGWIAIFTVGAYYGVQALRSGRMQVRTVSVLDSIAGGPAGWATHYVGIFAPRSDDYQLEGLAAQQWWSGLAASTDQMYARQSTLVTRQIYCQQTDGSNLPVSVPINIWTVQSLVGETPSEDVPFKVTVERAGDAATIELTNTSSAPIRAGFVLFRDAYVDIPPMAAGRSRRLEQSVRPFDPWFAGRTVQGIPNCPMDSLSGVATGTFLSPACLNRTLAMYDYLRQGAAWVCVEYKSASAPFRVKGHSYDAASICWARQIVLPRNAPKEQSHD